MGGQKQEGEQRNGGNGWLSNEPYDWPLFNNI
jgi:hypothetical protein